MIEKVSISEAMKEFPLAATADSVYAELDNGTLVRIKKSDLVELIRSAMPVATQNSNGLMSHYGIIYIGKNEGNLTDAGTSIGYSYARDGSGIDGPYLSIVGYGNYTFQLKSSVSGNALKFRIYNGEWTPWKSISFT